MPFLKIETTGTVVLTHVSALIKMTSGWHGNANAFASPNANYLIRSFGILKRKDMC